jgi:hypothetical protein
MTRRMDGQMTFRDNDVVNCVSTVPSDDPIDIENLPEFRSSQE